MNEASPSTDRAGTSPPPTHHDVGSPWRSALTTARARWPLRERAGAGSVSAPPFKRRRVAALLVALGLASLAHAALGPRYGGRLRVGLLELPKATEPVRATTPAERLLQGLAHDTLVGLGPDGLPMPGLAVSWSAGAEGHEWTLTLDPLARCHDGSTVSGEDAERSLRRFLRSPSPAAERLAATLQGGADFRARRADTLAGLQAKGTTLALRFGAALALPLAPLAAPAAAITSSSGAGCGPFAPTFVALGQRQALVAHGAHHRGRPFVDQLELRLFPDPSALKSALLAGELDVALGEGALGRPAAVLLLALDPRQPPFDTHGRRAAVNAVIDRQELVRHWLPGAEAAGALLPPALLSSPTTPSAPPRERLAGKLTLTVARDVPPQASQRVLACLLSAGLDVLLVVDDPERARLTTSGARLLAFWPEVPEAGLALAELQALAAAPAAVGETLAQAALERDFDRRRALLLRAESTLRDEQVLLPLAYLPLAARMGSAVHEAVVRDDGTLLLDSAWAAP